MYKSEVKEKAKEILCLNKKRTVKPRLIILTMFLMIIVGGIGNVLVENTLPSWAFKPLIDIERPDYEVISVFSDGIQYRLTHEEELRMKQDWTEEEVNELIRLEREKQKKIDELNIVMNHLNQTNNTRTEEMLLMETYVENLKQGKINVNVNHIISDKIDKAIRKASQQHKVEEALIRAVMRVESNFDPLVKSHAKAKGLMQLMDGTAKLVGVKNVWDIKENVLGGTKYLRDMLNRYNNDYKLALYAYNGGPTNVDDWLKKHGDGKNINYVPYPETRAYPGKVLNYYNIYKEIS